MKFALAGNPNCGKTTLFNSLTGSVSSFTSLWYGFLGKSRGER